MNKLSSIFLGSISFLGMSSIVMACEPCGCDPCSASSQPVAWTVPQDATPEQACQAINGGDRHITQYQTADGTQLIICSGQGIPAAESAGPPPSFDDLDQGHKGYLTEQDAEAYAPLINDFLYVSHHKKTIQRASYERWASHMN